MNAKVDYDRGRADRGDPLPFLVRDGEQLLAAFASPTDAMDFVRLVCRVRTGPRGLRKVSA